MVSYLDDLKIVITAQYDWWSRKREVEMGLCLVFRVFLLSLSELCWLEMLSLWCPESNKTIFIWGVSKIFIISQGGREEQCQPGHRWDWRDGFLQQQCPEEEEMYLGDFHHIWSHRYYYYCCHNQDQVSWNIEWQTETCTYMPMTSNDISRRLMTSNDN